MKSKRERHKELGRQRATIINRALRERPHDFMDVFKEEPVLSISAEMEAIEMEIMQPDFERLFQCSSAPKDGCYSGWYIPLISRCK